MTQPSRAPVQPGDVLAGKYVVERVLGVGGMGVVVAARHQLLGGRVALKFVLPELATSKQVVERFIKEAQAATRITSEHVARVTDVGTLDGGVPYMVMEYLEGRDLGSLLDAQRMFALPVAVDYLLQGLQAVAEAHANGVVHRDLKPTNFFLTKRADGTPLVKVLDFGIAKAVVPDAVGGAKGDLTGTHGTVGSPLYMSPEQIRSSRSVDARADIWAVGVMLHELLTGSHPFTADSAGALLAAILTDPPIPVRAVRPDVPEAVERAILGCLEKDLSRRIPSVRVLSELLAPFGSHDAQLSHHRITGISGATQVGETGAPAASVVAHFAAGVTPAVGQRTAGSWGSTRPEDGTKSPRSSGRRVLIAAAGLGTLAVGGALAAWLTLRSGPSDATAPVEADAQPAKPAEHAVQQPSPPAAPPPPVVEPAPVSATSTQAPAPSASAVVAPSAGKPPAPRSVSTRGRTAPSQSAPPAPATKPTARQKGALDGLIDGR
jgi:serine/threonine-protein kinase